MIDFHRIQFIFPVHTKVVRDFLFLLISIFSVSSFSQPSDFQKAKAFERKKMSDSAIYYYSKILGNNKQDAKILLMRGQVYSQKQEYDNAIKDFLQANKLSNDIASFDLAKTYARIGNEIKSLEYLKKNLTSVHKVQQVAIRLEPAFAKFEGTDDWKNFWKNDWYDKYDNQVGEARFMINNKDWLGVINFISDNIKENSKRHELLYFRARAYFEMGNFNSAISDFDAAIEVYRHNYEYYVWRAEAYTKLHKNKNALADYTEAIEIEPSVFNNFLRRGELNLMMTNYDAAEKDAELYLNLFENDSTAIYLAGKIQFAKGNYFGALSYFNKLIKEYPNTTKFLMARASSYQKTKMYVYALKDYDSCLFNEPNNTSALLERGNIYFMQESKKNACSDWRKAMKLGNFEANNLYLDNCR